MFLRSLMAVIGTVVMFAACSNDDGSSRGGGDSDGDTDTDTDGDTDTDTDTDTDGDTDTDTDGDSDSDSDTGTGDDGACEGVADVEDLDVDLEGGLGMPLPLHQAQDFVAGTDLISALEVHLCEFGSSSELVEVSLRADADGAPAASALFEGTIDTAPCTFPDFQPYCVDVGPVSVSAGETYWIVLGNLQFGDEDYVTWATDGTDAYTDGAAWVEFPTEGTWILANDLPSLPIVISDFVFRVMDGS